MLYVGYVWIFPFNFPIYELQRKQVVINQYKEKNRRKNNEMTMNEAAAPLGRIEWGIIAALVVLSLSIGIWNKKKGHVTGKTRASLLQLSISTIVTFSSTIAMLGVPSLGN